MYRVLMGAINTHENYQSKQEQEVCWLPEAIFEAPFAIICTYTCWGSELYLN